MDNAPFGHSFDPFKTVPESLFGLIVGELGEYVRSGYARVPQDGGLEYSLVCVCLNVFAVRYAHPDAYVFVPRSQADFSGWPTSYRRVVRILDELSAAGYLEVVLGRWNPSGTGERTQIRSTPALREVLSRVGLTLQCIETSRERPLIVLKDSDKEVVDLPEDPESVQLIRRMEEDLSLINYEISCCFIGLHVGDIELHWLAEDMAGQEKPRYLDFSERRLRRVFNNSSLVENGRFVGGWWQSVPQRFRKHIHIAYPGGEHGYVAEVDYTSMHPAIAYALRNIAMDFDPYEIEAVANSSSEEQRKEIRKVSKQSLVTMLNASSPEIAELAIRDHFVKERDRYGTRTDEHYLPEGCPRIPEVMEQLEVLNPVIQEEFYQGKWGTWMNYESRIAEQAMLHMIRESAVVLPIHDSFLVHNTYRHELDRAMLDAFLFVMGKECLIDPDPVEVDDPPRPVLPERSWESEASVFFEMLEDWQTQGLPAQSIADRT